MSVETPDARDLYCPACGYNLHGISSDRCPECGDLIDIELAARSRVPWEHRRQIGLARAFWKTIATAFFTPGKLAQEKDRPVRAPDAQRFRRICVFIAWISITFPVVFTLIFNPYFGSRTVGDFFKAVATGIIAAVAFWIYLSAFTLIPRWFFDPTERDTPNWGHIRSLALYCASAPLILMPLVVIVFYRQVVTMGKPLFGPPQLIALALMGALSVWPPVRFIRAAIGCGLGRTLAALIAIPILWIVLLVFIGAVAVVGPFVRVNLVFGKVSPRP